MTKVTYGELPPEQIQSDSIIPFENTSSLTKRGTALEIAILASGSSVEYISTEADLPPLINGFRTLEIDKSYIWLEPALHFDKILIPAGWIGFLKRTFFQSNAITYAGTGAFINTLNIDGSITSFADSGTSPGEKTTVTTSVAHGLLDDQFVNITDTTTEPAYSQQSLQISNVTASTFDIEIVFTVTDTGNFNTGYGSMQFIDYSVQNPTSATFLDITSGGTAGSSLLFTRFANIGFQGMGTIRNGLNIVARDTVFTFISTGLTLDDCEDFACESTNFLDLAGVGGVIALNITGSLTKNMNILNSSFDMANPGQFPVRIDASVTAADKLAFLNSPDNNVATDYFDTLTGGLDQTDPQVIADGNGLRADSMIISESSSAGILVVDGSGSTDVPIVDLTPSPGDWVEDPTTETLSVDTTTGIVTYNGLNTITAMIKYSLAVAQSTGGNQTVDLDLHINGVLQTKSTITIVTSGTSNFIPGVYNGGNFTINPGDTMQLFKNNITNTNNTDVQNAILLFNRD